MKSKKSFFSLPLLRSNFTRFWPLWITFLASMLILYPIGCVGGAERWWKGATAIDVSENLLEMSLQAGTVIMFVAGAIFAMLLFSYLYTAKSAGMYASLPVRRETLFITNYLSGIIIFTAAMLLTAVAVIVAELAIGLFSFKYILMWLGISFMQFILFYSLAVFCGMLTGHIIVLPALYAVLSFMMVFIDMLIGSILEQFVYGYVSQQLIPEVLTPVVHIMSDFNITDVADVAPNGAAEVVDLAFSHTGAAIAYTVVGVILAVLSLFIYRRRHMETATDIVAVKQLKPIFKYCMTFGCALVLGMLLFIVMFNDYMSDDGLVPMICLTGCMIIGGIIGYFVSKMLMEKSFRVFRKGWGGVVISSLIIVLLMCACEFDLFGYEHKVPEAEDVQGVLVYGYGESVVVDEEENIEKAVSFHKSVIENKKSFENANSYTYHARMIYTLKNGETLERRYNVYPEEEGGKESTDILESIVNSEEAIDDRLHTETEITADNVIHCDVEWRFETEIAGDVSIENKELTKEETAELYKAIMKDKAEGKIGRSDALDRYAPEYLSYFHCTVYIEYATNNRDDEGSYINYGEDSAYVTKEVVRADPYYVSTLRVEVMEESENTLNYLKSIGIEPMSYTDGQAVGIKIA